MFNPNKKQNNVLEKFRIKAHLRSYVKDPVVIDEALLQDAVERLKKLPYRQNDPTDSVVIKLVREAYRTGNIKDHDLTEDGCTLVRLSKHGRQHQTAKDRLHQAQPLRHRH